MKLLSVHLPVIKQLQHFRRTMSSASKVSIKVAQGTVLGAESKLPNGHEYVSFKGIPYAVPPVGGLRFQPPLPLERFKSPELDCSEEGCVSFHKDPISSELVGGEDCLFLNVYTPKLDSKKPLPVMVFLHGGAFIMGSGNSDLYSPLTLTAEEVVVVTLNYRLGIFGFLHLPDGNIPGNMALRDQLLALKWVKDNISQFNGDPDNVCLFGHSAGAAAVHLHTLSPESKKYFHKAIMQSGNAVMEWSMQKNSIDKARKLAQLMGCNAKTDKEISEFLMNEKDPVKFIVHLLNIMTADERRRGLPIPVQPIVEPNIANAIVPKPPLSALMEKDSIQIPIMMGYTSKEGITMLPTAVKKLDELNKDLERLIPRSVSIEPDNPKVKEIAQQMRDFYFKGQELSKNNLNELSDLLSDYHFIIGSHIGAEIHSRRQHKSPLYFYRFNFDGEFNYFKKLFGYQQSLKGACHGDELFYLFQTMFTNEPMEPGSGEERVLKQMNRLWANFAKYSNPTPSEDNLINFKWIPVKKINDNDEFVLDCLEIDENTRMERNPEKERIDFWRSVFRTWNGCFTKAKL